MPGASPSPTLYDVAREAGVSLATASRVLNGSARTVADEYRARVLAAATTVGYQANFSAQAMARGTSRFAALLVSDIADPFFSTIAAGVSRAAEREGLVVTMSVTDRDPERELELLRELRGLRPRLVVLVGSRFTDEPQREQLVAELAGFESGGARVVLIGQHELPFTSLGVDNVTGARALATALATSLVESGRREFAVLAGPADLVTARDRLAGFRDGLAEAGIRIDESRIVHDAFTRDGGHRAMTALLTAEPEAELTVFAVNDVMAVGALTALREAGVDVPGRIAVAGFDDIDAARDTSPALTTVHIDLGELGERAVALALAAPVLESGGAEGSSPRSDLLPTRVVLRASTGH